MSPSWTSVCKAQAAQMDEWRGHQLHWRWGPAPAAAESRTLQQAEYGNQRSSVAAWHIRRTKSRDSFVFTLKHELSLDFRRYAWRILERANGWSTRNLRTERASGRDGGRASEWVEEKRRKPGTREGAWVCDRLGRGVRSVGCIGLADGAGGAVVILNSILYFCFGDLWSVLLSSIKIFYLEALFFRSTSFYPVHGWVAWNWEHWLFTAIWSTWML